MVSDEFPNVTTSSQQYNIGEKPSVILYTYINLHARTPKPQSHLSVWGFRTTVVVLIVLWSYMVFVVVVVFTLKAVPVSTQYFLTSVLVQLTRTPSVVTG